MNHLKQKTTMSKKTIEAWVARDENGSLYMYTAKPKKLSDYWNAPESGCMELDDRLFHDVQWSDEEPKGIILSIKDKSKIKSALSFLGRIGLFVFILCCTVLGILHLIQWIIWQTLQ